MTALALIQKELSRCGRLSFAEFMGIALHHPEVGYYATQQVFGPRGDYVTSPELHPAFGALIGRQLAEVWEFLGCPGVFRAVEVGAGSGALCRDLLEWSDHSAERFARALQYEIVEPNPKVQAQQRAVLASAALEPSRVSWRASLSEAGPIVGCLFSNELLDTQPVHLVAVRSGSLREVYVVERGGRLDWAEGEPSTPALEAYFSELRVWPQQGARAEVNLAALDWTRQAADALQQGLLLSLDYGYPAASLYRGRPEGTLLCFYRHTLSSNPLRRVGRQDITTHVDFSSVMRAGEQGGLTSLGLVSQTRFLVNLGIEGHLAGLGRLALPQAELQANRRALLALVDPHGLGRLGVIAQQRGLDGFVAGGLAGPPAAEPAWTPVLGSDSARLPAASELDGLPDFEAQWKAFWGGQEEAEETHSR